MVDADDRVHRRPRPRAWELTRASGRDGAELLHQGDAVELRPDVGHATVLEAVVHALDLIVWPEAGIPMSSCC